MKTKFDITIITALMILIIFIASFLTDLTMIKSGVIILITFSLIFEFINWIKIKNRLKNKEISSIIINKPRSGFVTFWWIMLILWIIFTLVSLVSGDNFILGLLNIWICLNWLFFRDSRFSIYYNSDTIWYTRYKTHIISFNNVLDYKVDSDRIILTIKNDREIKLPRYKVDTNNEIYKVIERSTLPNTPWSVASAPT